jgi:hypothetical protein
MSFKLEEFKPGHDAFFRELVERQLVASCINCISFTNQGNCLKFKTAPPPKVIVFSCGPNWEGDLPF